MGQGIHGVCPIAWHAMGVVVTLILNLGVIDQYYTQPGKGAVSTGDVATWLENKYHLMEVFYEDNRPFVEGAIVASIKGATINVIAGGNPSKNIFSTAEADIIERFKQAISLEEFDGVMPGVPTQAAKDGRSLRFKRKRGPSRASFYDTGLYQASFKAWMEEG